MEGVFRAKKGGSDARVGIKCLRCCVGMHEQCNDTYHQVKEGVVLDLDYEINLVCKVKSH